jgi:lipoyl(octanoyl) transferase
VDNKTVIYENLGLMRYQEAWDYQTAVHKGLVDHKMLHKHLEAGSYAQNHRLILVEHPPVYTLGRSGSLDNLLISESELQARGIDYFPINRGGDITFHGPGQIVGYPILDLECFYRDVHRYVRDIEEVMIRTLADYQIAAQRIEGYTGVWLAPDPSKGPEDFWGKYRKICAIGVHISRWVTLHGWAFNINTPLEYFEYMIPCGIAEADKTVTSLSKELGHPIDMEATQQLIVQHFSDVFEATIHV